MTERGVRAGDHRRDASSARADSVGDCGMSGGRGVSVEKRPQAGGGPRDALEGAAAASGREWEPSGRPPGASYLALRQAVAQLSRLDDFSLETIGRGFFSEVYRVSAACESAVPQRNSCSVRLYRRSLSM